MSAAESIDFREQIDAYIASPDLNRLTVVLLSGEKYLVAHKSDILLLPYVVFVFLGSSAEVCFPFEMICHVEMFRKRET